ncbi:hypothetical protein BGZ79_008237 [Entomortierella chlamydospora]|nr:hypothetical protein BGZ79_008237 [Entomortierella chlamydospora]
MNPIPSPPSFHALDLPEIVFGIAQYLDAADVLACSAVSKSFYCSFAPFVWQDLHFGQPYTFTFTETLNRHTYNANHNYSQNHNSNADEAMKQLPPASS